MKGTRNDARTTRVITWLRECDDDVVFCRDEAAERRARTRRDPCPSAFRRAARYDTARRW